MRRSLRGDKCLSPAVLEIHPETQHSKRKVVENRPRNGRCALVVLVRGCGRPSVLLCERAGLGQTVHPKLETRNSKQLSGFSHLLRPNPLIKFLSREKAELYRRFAQARVLDVRGVC